MSRDEPYNASDSADVKAAAKQARQQDREDEDVLRGLAATTAGRAWLYRFLSKACIWQTTFTGDGLQSAFLEGQRNLGLTLLNDLVRVCPDQFLQMMREANERTIASDVAANARRNQRTDDTADSDNYVNYSAASGTNTAKPNGAAAGED